MKVFVLPWTTIKPLVHDQILRKLVFDPNGFIMKYKQRNSNFIENLE